MKISKNLFYFSLMLIFFNFSMLLNCMGVMILQLSNERQTYDGLGYLEIFKDVPIAIISIFSTLYIAKIGNLIAIRMALFISLLCCFALPFLEAFWFFKIWFALIGISFAISKIAVFSVLRNHSQSDTEFSKSMSAIESMFMLGVFLINISFSYLLSTDYHHLWKFGFWGIGVLIIVNLIMLLFSEKNNFLIKEKEEINSKVLFSIPKQSRWLHFIFFFLVFCVVFVEQSLSSWLPSFYKEHFKSSPSVALQSTAILALFSFLGRIFTSKNLQNYSWKNYILFFLINALILILITHILFNYYFSHSNFIMYIFPLIGFFLAPLYPVFNSQFLSKQSPESVKVNVSYINFFSSIGSSVGSYIMATIFQNKQSSHFLFFLSLILLIIFLLGYFFVKKIKTIQS